MKKMTTGKKLYIVTGADGHLGNTIVRMLQTLPDPFVRGLLLPGVTPPCYQTDRVQYVWGDIRDLASLEPLFENTAGMEVYVIHTAGIVDISQDVTPQIYDVNVNGTKNMLALCRKYQIKRLVYVSSVHAIPEKNDMSVIAETKMFSSDAVIGGYAKTKAEATQAVLDAAADGLDAVVVHPSGILGPYCQTGNYLVQLVTDYLEGHLPACVKGGYDFVDVRDVAIGCLLAAEKGRRGESYILSNRHYEIKDLLYMVRKAVNGKRLPRKLPVLPMWMARAAAPVIQFYAKCRHIRPLYTTYSLYTLQSNDKFTHDKATKELGYHPRDLYETIRDTVRWYQSRHRRKAMA